MRGKSKKKKKDLVSKQVTIVSILMLAAAVIFNLYITTPVLSYGVNDAGDDSYHVAQSYYLKKLVLEEHTIFGVMHAYGAGYPWFNTHQFLMYALEVGLNLATFEMISLLDAHKILLILFYSLFPVGIYYALRKYKQPPLLCGIGALLSVTLISGWGHTTSAYFVIGLTSQAASGFLFPFALASFHELITEGRGHRKTALLYVLTAFAHPYYGYFLAFTSVIDIIIYSFRKNKTEVIRTLKYAMIAGIVAFGLAIFWIAPLPETIHYAPRNLLMQAVKASFSIESLTTYFISGELLDVSNNFDDPPNKNLRWPITSGKGRLPVLTALTIIGLVYSVLKRDRFAIFCIVGIIFSFMQMVGSDDIPALSYLPLSEHANAKRAIYLFEFFVICFSARALYWILSTTHSLAGRITGRRVGAIAASILLLGVLYTPYNERILSGERDVNTLSHWLVNFNAMKAEIKRDGYDGRVYGDDEVGVSTAPVILSLPWILDTPYMRRIYVTRFWGDILNYPNNFHIFNIRYLVVGAHKEIPENITQMFTELYRDRVYALYRVEGDYGPAVISHKKPALLVSHEGGWRIIAEVWLHYYKNSKNRDYLPFIVHYQGQKVDAGDYSQLMRYDIEPEADLLAKFNGEVFRANHSYRHPLVRTALKDSKKKQAIDKISIISHTQHRFLATVETDKEGILAYKVTYHPDWKVKVNGIERELLRATPEYPAVFIKPGKHIVEFTYEKSKAQIVLNIISFLTLIYVLAPSTVLEVIKRKLRV